MCLLKIEDLKELKELRHKFLKYSAEEILRRFLNPLSNKTDKEVLDLLFKENDQFVKKIIDARKD